MWRNYVKIAWRNLLKNKVFSFINVLGLAIGMAACLLIVRYVGFELSYDKFHEKAGRIYRIAKEDPGNYYFGSNRFAVTPAPLVVALMEEFPEVEHATQIQWVNSQIDFEEKKQYVDGIYATAYFFDVFTFAFLHGDPNTALAEPNSIILTESLARKYFGDADPVGRSLSVTHSNEKAEMNIAGVIEDAPTNSHFSFEYLVSMSSSASYAENIDQWDDNNYLTYVSLRENSSLPSFGAKLQRLSKKYLGEYEYYKNNPDKITAYFPQALTDIHLKSHINFEFGNNSDIKYVYLFAVLALLILLIAAINYMNLTTARSVLRAKEVGVRKVIGANRAQLVVQYMGEAIIPSILALLISILLVEILLPQFNSLTQRQLVLDIFQNGILLTTLILFGIGVGILAGMYPALVMSRFNPVNAIKVGLQNNQGKPFLRNVLVIFQFAVTIPLILGTIVIQQQLAYIQNADTGINRDHIVSIHLRDTDASTHLDAISQSLQKHPNVLGTTGSWHPPTKIAQQSGTTQWEGVGEGQEVSIYHMAVQPDFINLFGIELTEGRDFSDAVAPDQREDMLINETLMRQLGWDTAVGKQLYLNGRDARVIGVMKDFNFQSFHQEMAPLALYLDSERIDYLFVKVRPEEMQGTIEFLRNTLAEFSPGFPFDYQFLDDAYNRMYQTETRIGVLFSYFTGLALFLASMGLLGLVAFTASQRTKEIGVRKVLGASVVGIVILLSKDFLKLVVIAFVIATPLSGYIINRWLEEFAYRIEIQWWMFALAGLFAALIAIITISFQSTKAALVNPVDSLRLE